jgi:carboxylesterase type B
MTCPESFSENCLNLDIYTPLPSTGGDDPLKPVMLFFPGGRFEQGGAGTLLYDSRYLASHSDIVSVIINYRLG